MRSCFSKINIIKVINPKIVERPKNPYDAVNIETWIVSQYDLKQELSL